VIVETSGLADPGPVAQTLFADQALARDFKLGPIVTVVDAADAGGRRLAGAVAQAQIAAADVVVLSKTDRAADVGPAKAEVQAINAGAECIAASFGDVDPAILRQAYPDKTFAGAQHGSEFQSFVLSFAAPVPRALLERFLALLVDLRGRDLLRVKGTVALEEGAVVLAQGVRHVFDRLREVNLPPTGLVFITRGVGKTEIEGLWQAMSNIRGKP
jgi:G3E family GTPase